MIEITSNEIKTKGISIIDALGDNNDGAVITVKGKRKYVVIPIEKYNKLRELELELAVQEVRKDLTEGKYYSGIEEHIKRITDV
ncbi:MAG: type II toxin-antitoxin system Phd/YefM family antitoxin [Candidatus Kapabacteria bacterium]|nr:type II toxin-antitoxin system Phd/YefM family antitoxin [Candidatus Kapabacteria bacterium]